MSSSYVLFYGLMGLMLLVALLMVVPTLLRPKDSADGEADAIYQGFLKDALTEEKRRLDEELERGSLSPELYAELRDELAHRAVEEHGRAASGGDPLSEAAKPLKTSNAVVAAGVAALLISLSVGCYAFLGAPELMRLAEDQTVLEGTATAQALETYLADNPKDGRAWVLLARRKAEAGDFIASADAYRKARMTDRRVAADPVISTEFGAALLSTNVPALFEEAKGVLTEALEREPDNMQLVELTAIAAMQTADWPLAARHLRTLLRTMTPDRPEYLRYEEALRELDRRAAEFGTGSSAAP